MSFFIINKLNRISNYSKILDKKKDKKGIYKDNN